mgnify:CR=1 FL=1
MADVWERHDGEGAKAYQAFALYRDMDPDARSTVKVGQQTSKNLRLIHRWSARWSWVDRAEAYDDHMDRLHRKQQEKERLDMLRRHAGVALAFMGKAVEGLKEIKAEELSNMDRARWVDLAVRVERLSRGEPTEHIRQEIDESGQERALRQYYLSTPELREKLLELATILADSVDRDPSGFSDGGN